MHLILTLILTLILIPHSSTTALDSNHEPPTPAISTDAAALLTFKSTTDLNNTLHYTLTEHFDYCHWQGVKCQSSRVIRLFLPNSSLRGPLLPNAIPLLRQLRVLVLKNNSLSGPLPDFSSLTNLRSLILSRNLFSGPFPFSLVSLYKLRVIDLSFNNFSASVPVEFWKLDRLTSLKLEFNHLSGPLPLLNQSTLELFNVSSNNFSGEIPLAPTLSRFPLSSFVLNPNLCGKLVDKPCVNPSSPFFDSSSAATNHPSSSSSSTSLLSPPSSAQVQRHSRKKVLIVVTSFAGVFLLSSLICVFITARARTRTKNTTASTTTANNSPDAIEKTYFQSTPSPEVIRVALDSHINKPLVKCAETVQKSSDLVFSEAESKLYTLEQLMRASAEMLGRGTVGTTYKAKLDNQLIVTVKRVDAIKFRGVNGEIFERHLGIVCGLRHPNLVPVRAFFQAKDERLIIFDYQPNGSVFNLIHGSRSTRAKPLHWTSCLKIAEDVAQGLAYIHQASKLIHGNIKATNVLLGVDFEACLTDYCLSTLASSSETEDPDSSRYTAPEARQSGRRATHESDVFSFGVLLLELLSGKPPSRHPCLALPDMADWVKAVRMIDEGSEENQLGMLVEVASLCSSTSPEQRPAMWQVLKMIQRIKTSVGPDNGFDSSAGYA